MEHPLIEFEGRVYRVVGSYYSCHDKWKQTPRMLHRDVWASANGPIPDGYHVHHKDENKLNNDINNLELLSSSEHKRVHGKDGEWQLSERNLEILREARAKSHEARRRPENRARNAERWKTNEKLHAWIGSDGAKESLKKAIEAAKEWHSSPEGKEWHSQNGKQSWEKRRPVDAICQQCGAQYKAYFPTRSKFCHPNCKAAALRKRAAAGNQT